MSIQNIWICGLGGVGGYFGGRMAYRIQSSQNMKYKVYFLARGSHLKEIESKGLILQTSEGEVLICKPTLASENIDDFPIPDLCLICVKSYDLENLLSKIEQKLSNNTIIIPLMNGIDIYDRIRKVLKKSIVLPACVYIGAHIEHPGLVIQTGNPGFFYCGLDPTYPEFDSRILINFFEEMDLKMIWQNDPYQKIWEKYILVASFALVTAHTGQTLGGVINDTESVTILKKVMEEIVLIAKKKGGIKLENNIIEKIIEFCKDYPDAKTSYQRDIEKGKKNEGDIYGGAVIQMGKELGIPTPMTSKIYNR